MEGAPRSELALSIVRRTLLWPLAAEAGAESLAAAVAVPADSEDCCVCDALETSSRANSVKDASATMHATIAPA